jgi:A/G-specific adenine glycosylase
MAINNDCNQHAKPAKFPGLTWRRKLRRQLLNWFRHNARDLPWRDAPTPYQTWVSEIMLQQTQVATVVEYYQRFLKRFPDVQTLATATEQEVLRSWEGLGYYRRARQLHRAAKTIMTDHGGCFPITFPEVLALPGIGRYTAGAILSISLGQRHPIVEANSIRLFARLLHVSTEVRATQTQKLFWEFATWILPHKHLSDFNQALMEVGSLICTPTSPACDKCPLRSLCPTVVSQAFDEIPKPKQKTEYEQVQEVAVVVKHRDGQRVLLRQCQADQRWAGLWDFPRFECDIKCSRVLTTAEQQQIRQQTRDLAHVQIDDLRPLTSLKHGVTKYRITLNCYFAKLKRDQTAKNPTLQWVSLDELDNYPLSTTGRKICQVLTREHV